MSVWCTQENVHELTIVINILGLTTLTTQVSKHNGRSEQAFHQFIPDLIITIFQISKINECDYNASSYPICIPSRRDSSMLITAAHAFLWRCAETTDEHRSP